ncbi:MAG: hypothetical protein LBO81_04885, partial [Clostridiales Family XIII bacterium]|nr:hypothetical protein [Clostridiales Family XIII bacterium]
MSNIRGDAVLDERDEVTGEHARDTHEHEARAHGDCHDHAHSREAQGDCCGHAHAQATQKPDRRDAHGCACCGKEESGGENIGSAPFIIGIVLFALGFVLEHFGSSFVGLFAPGAAGSVSAPLLRWGPAAVSLIAYLLIGRSVLLTAGKNILRGRVFDENFLMAIASIGAFVIGEYPEA